MNHKNPCYKLETIEYKNTLFKSIDASYVLTMENSKRRKQYMEQLEKYKPTKTVYIQHNKGYKKCKKNLCKNNSMYDLSDANINVMKHSLKYKGNIIIFEDDFFFSKDMVKKDIVRIESFIKNNKFDCYSLGCLPITSIYIKPFHLRIYKFGGAHAMILSYDIRKKILNDYNKNICNIIMMDAYYSKYNCFTYYKPICYQIFPVTKNQLMWGQTSTKHIKFNKFIGKTLVGLSKITGIDKRAEPTFSLLNLFSRIYPMVSIFIFIYILVYYGPKLVKNINIDTNIFNNSINKINQFFKRSFFKINIPNIIFIGTPRL